MKFSVVIATYNRRGMVLDAIRSVVEQSARAHQVIVVVDGSTDGTATAVRQRYPDVCLIEQPNRGPSVAHNAGIAAATGDWVCFLDDDDLWHRDKLAATSEYLSKHRDCRACNNPVWWFSADASETMTPFGFRRDFVARTLEECHAAVASGDPSANLFEYLQILGRSFDCLRERNRGALSSSSVNRDVLIGAGCFCPMQTCGDDWTMFLNVSRLCEWHTIPRRLTFCRVHPGQNTGDASNGLYTLVGIANAWLTGRGCVEKTRLADIRRDLARYAPTYRSLVQRVFWGALRDGDIATARMVRAAGALVLPRLRDRLYSLIPPPVAWRVERYLFGMHKWLTVRWNAGSARRN
jgi:glycosyltransferase involved in cell wall biosynthesis